MAKSFISAQAAAAELGVTENGLKDLVREGKLREFRDGAQVNYKVTDVEKIKGEAAPTKSAGGTDVSAESGEILLEPAEESGIDLSPAGSDVLSLEGSDMLEATSSSTASPAADKEGSAVPSVGVSVFDDEDASEEVDPLAQTAVGDVAGLGQDAMGSGSGILDLTRESDDTSLGAELLEEIYSSEEGQEAKAESGIAAVADDTRAGLDDGTAAGVLEEAPFEVETEEVAASAGAGAAGKVVDYPADAVSSGLTAGMAVALAVMLVGALASVSLVRGTMPALLSSVYSHLLYFTVGGLLVVGAAVAVTYLVAKRSS